MIIYGQHCSMLPVKTPKDSVQFTTSTMRWQAVLKWKEKAKRVFLMLFVKNH